MTRIRTALYLDFDNVFGGLLRLDRRAAMVLAEQPALLLDRLGESLSSGEWRDILIRRAYLNPHGWIRDEELGNEAGRLYLSKFRPALTRAGFEVIDCPALTSAQKNAADIRMVIDILQLLDHPTRFEEVMVASSDADFTPLLQQLRTHDRRTTIVTAGLIAPAYGAIADRHIDDTELIAMLTEDRTGEDDTSILVAEDAVVDPVSASEAEEARKTATQIVEQQLADASAPLLLSDIGHTLHNAMDGRLIRSTRYFGCGSLATFVSDVAPDVTVNQLHVWDPLRHDAPLAGQIPSSAMDIPEPIASLCSIAEMPRLRSEYWPAVFTALALYAATHDFNLTESTAWTRDHLADQEIPVGRSVLSFVVRGALLGEEPLNQDPPPDALRIAEGFARSVLSRADALGLDVTDDVRDALTDWLAGRGEPTAE